MLTRANVRHTCYRMKSGANPSPGNEHIPDIILPLIPGGESWSTFAERWDTFVEKNGIIHIIVPEIDYDFIHSTCLEAALYTKKKLPFDFDKRALNVIQIVELNMMENMKWEDYNKTWGVSVDYELKKIDTRWFKTNKNVVTNEMIESSKISDGTELTEAVLPVVQVDMQPSEPTEAEKALLAASLKKKFKK